MPVFQGTYYSRTFVFKRSTDNSVIDITGWTFECMVRARIDEPELLTLTTLNGGFTVVNGPQGQVTLALTSDQTASLPAAKLIFDVVRTDVSPGPVWQFGGKFPVRVPVTRDD